MSKEELNGKDVEDINASIIVINKKLSNDHSRSINWEFLLECFKPGVEEDEEAWLVRVKSRVARILVDLSSKSTSVGEIVDKHNAALVLTALLRGYIQVAKKNSDSPERTSLHQIFAKHQESQTAFRPTGRKSSHATHSPPPKRETNYRPRTSPRSRPPNPQSESEQDDHDYELMARANTLIRYLDLGNSLSWEIDRIKAMNDFMASYYKSESSSRNTKLKEVQELIGRYMEKRQANIFAEAEARMSANNSNFMIMTVLLRPLIEWHKELDQYPSTLVPNLDEIKTQISEWLKEFADKIDTTLMEDVEDQSPAIHQKYWYVIAVKKIWSDLDLLAKDFKNDPSILQTFASLFELKDSIWNKIQYFYEYPQGYKEKPIAPFKRKFQQNLEPWRNLKKSLNRDFNWLDVYELSSLADVLYRDWLLYSRQLDQLKYFYQDTMDSVLEEFNELMTAMLDQIKGSYASLEPNEALEVIGPGIDALRELNPYQIFPMESEAIAKFDQLVTSFQAIYSQKLSGLFGRKNGFMAGIRRVAGKLLSDKEMSNMLKTALSKNYISELQANNLRNVYDLVNS